MEQKAYFGLDWIVSLILAIIPITSMVCGIITRFQREPKKPIWGIIHLVSIFIFGIGIFVFWIVDLVSMIVNKDLKWLMDNKIFNQ